MEKQQIDKSAEALIIFALEQNPPLNILKIEKLIKSEKKKFRKLEDKEHFEDSCKKILASKILLDF